MAGEMKTERSVGDRGIIGGAVEGEEEREGRRGRTGGEASLVLTLIALTNHMQQKL